MPQALAVAWDVDRLVALGLREGSDSWIKQDALAIGTGLALDYGFAFFLTQPLLVTHEEWHLVALREGGVTGRNDFLRGEVTRVSDAELVAFKADDPAGLVRAHSAGLESQNALVRRIGDEAFLGGRDGFALGPLDVMGTWMAPHAQYAEFNTWNYLRYCSSGLTDDVVPFVEDLEGGPEERDFTGPDCTAWARDLFRPDEPYEARGVHASGDGLGRYVAWGDLTGDEQALLRLQTRLHWLDLLNPHLFGVDRVHVGDHAYTASVMHWLTPYGYALDLHVGARSSSGRGAVLGTLRLGVSDGRAFPAVDVDLVNVRLGARTALDAGVAAWLQPRDLRWGAAPTPGGRAAVRGVWRFHDRFEAWAGLEAKSAGWSPGLAALDPAVYGRVGASALLGRPSAVW